MYVDSLVPDDVAIASSRWRDLLFPDTDVGLLVIEPAGLSWAMDRVRVVHVDACFVELTGARLTAGEEVERTAFPILMDWLPFFTRVCSESEDVRAEYWSAPASRWLHLRFVAVPGDRGGIGIRAADITDQKQHESAMLERIQRYRSLIDALPLPVWVLAATGETRFVNRLFEDFFGCTRAQRESFRWENLIHSDDLAGFRYDLAEALRERKSLVSLVRGRRSDGQWRWLEMSGAPRWGVQGRFLGLAGNCRDVTDRRELEEANEQLLRSERAARSAAESTSRLKDEFMATISHELRTPLTTVIGWSDLLLQRIDPADPLYKGLNVISASGQALKRLIADMLDLSGMLMGKLKLDMEPLDLVEEVFDAARALDLTVRESHLSLEMDLPDTRCLVLGDRTRIQQILWNLLSNAGKFTPEGGCIKVGMRKSGDRCLVTIEDNGVGIAPEFLPHLFTRFRQADGTTTRRYGGLGLGLSIVQQLVELHGGRVTASSAGIGLGASFVLDFPLNDAVNDGVNVFERLPRIKAVGTDSDSLSNLRLMLVDDQRDIHELMRHSLERHGAQVHTASSSADALRLIDAADHARYDLVISDIGMPGMDGYALAKVIREELGLPASTLPMIALTALASVEDRQRALASGFQAHVAKPCNMAILISEICRLVGRL